ncbi:hypothetical protein HY629_00630 [Candidatus Uhrbacteria bacterium]|nr:hypothetical protein [Candidatus Uhrbacteria bacterium]
MPDSAHLFVVLLRGDGSPWTGSRPGSLADDPSDELPVPVHVRREGECIRGGTALHELLELDPCEREG